MNKLQMKAIREALEICRSVDHPYVAEILYEDENSLREATKKNSNLSIEERLKLMRAIEWLEVAINPSN